MGWPGWPGCRAGGFRGRVLRVLRTLRALGARSLRAGYAVRRGALGVRVLRLTLGGLPVGRPAVRRLRLVGLGAGGAVAVRVRGLLLRCLRCLRCLWAGRAVWGRALGVRVVALVGVGLRVRGLGVRCLRAGGAVWGVPWAYGPGAWLYGPGAWPYGGCCAPCGDSGGPASSLVPNARRIHERSSRCCGGCTGSPLGGGNGCEEFGGGNGCPVGGGAAPPHASPLPGAAPLHPGGGIGAPCGGVIGRGGPAACGWACCGMAEGGGMSSVIGAISRVAGSDSGAPWPWPGYCCCGCWGWGYWAALGCGACW